ncbi:MAG TPA: hypothetical protein VF173_07165 [Thermoanaerobaculia bacterium]|nr:hypothetical protein [Thermoanaerobaculia bacterium]
MVRPAAALLLLMACPAMGSGESLADLAPIRSGRVTLRVPPGEQARPELVHLAADLDRAAAEMAPKLAVRETKPLTVILEPDHVAQGQHTGEIGEAVPGPQADLYLVWDARDLGAYRYALARVLLSRSLAARPPPWLERGAALWLSGDWYGRPWREWLPLFAAAKVLPTAEDLLAPDDARDASLPLWTPAAAAVVEKLPGATVAEKLAQPPSRETVAATLARLTAVPIQKPKSKIQNASPVPPFLAGVSLAMLNRLESGYHAPSVGRQLDAFAALGANAVSLMPFAFQRAADGPALAYMNHGPGSETDIGLIHATRLARAKGFHVLYKPHVWVSHGGWPGEIEMKSEAGWAAWWQGYRRYVLHHAFLARWAGADLFSIGCELSKTVKREAEWRDLIAAVRLLYPGVVTYSGNWYGDLEGVRFWDALDVIGIDSYYPLSPSPQATRADLERGAREVAERFAAASRRTGKKVLLTETGFAAHRGAWLAPHTEGGEYSEGDQALAYQALFVALGRQSWLAGTFVWKAFSAPLAHSRDDADFRFQGRKAEGVIREYYRGHL